MMKITRSIDKDSAHVHGLYVIIHDKKRYLSDLEYRPNYFGN